MIRSHWDATCVSCVTITRAPSSLVPFSRSTSRTPAAERESREPVGSSAKMTLGELTSARAIATRCDCPPESCPMRRWPRPSRPSRRNSLSARSSAVVLDTPISKSGSAMFSAAVSSGSSIPCWKTNPNRRSRKADRASSESVARSSNPVPSERLTKTAPESGVRIPARTYRRVDFPEPLGPIIATDSPGVIETLASASASVVPNALLAPFA
ncbi:hypothetical protein ACIFOC_00094 [Leucobacter aridicollis]